MRRAFGWLAALVLLDVLWTIGRVAWAEHSVDAPAAPAPVVAILYGDEGVLGANTERSLHAALPLIGPDTFVLCVGGARPTRSLFGAESMAAWLVARGVPQARMHIDRASFDTATNIEVIAQWQRRSSADMIVIADALHARRVRAAIARAGLAGVRVHAYSLARATPAASPEVYWLRVHHETIADALELLLPSAAYRQLLRTLRSQA